MQRFHISNIWSIAILSCLVIAQSAAYAADWPQEMGPERRGVTTEQPEVVAWGQAGPRVLWRANVGYGSVPVAVADGRVFAFGAFKAGADVNAGPTPDKVAWAGFSGVGGGNAAKPLEGTNTEEKIGTWVFAFDETSGKRLWASRIWDGVIPPNDIDWSHAAPLVVGNTVVVHTFYGVVAALNATSGEILWTVNLFDVGMTMYHTKAGNMCSPLLLPDGKAVAVSYGFGGNTTEMQCAAFNLDSGKLLWQSEKFGEGFRSNQSSIFLADLAGKPTILLSTGGLLAGIDPADGGTRWKRSFEDLFPKFGRLRRAGRESDAKAALRPLFEEEVPGGGEEEWEKWYAGGCYGIYRCTYPNRMPMAWNDHIVDGMYIWHQMRDSKTFALRMQDGEPVLDWQADQLADTRGYFVIKDGRLYGMDHREGGFNTPGTRFFDMRPYHQRGPRPDAIGQFQCYDIASGELLWSSDVLSTEPEEQTNLYNGSARFIIAGDHVILWGREGLRVALILPDDAGLEIVARYARKASYPSIPVFANGRLYLRRLNPNASQRHDPFLNDGEGHNLIVLDMSAKGTD